MIALGVGVNTGIFSVLNSLALRELRAPDADELVSVHQVVDGDRFFRPVRGSRNMFSTGEYRAYRDGTQTLSGILAFSMPQTVTLGQETPREIDGAFVTCNYFAVLRLPLALGPGFAADDCESDGSVATAVLAHDLWASEFGADPSIIGRAVLLNRQAFTVVGVAPEGMHGVDVRKVAFFAPISAQPLFDSRGNAYREEESWLTLIGRRTNQATLGQVRAELAIIAAGIDREQAPRRTALVVDRATVGSSPEDRASLFAAGGIVMAAFGLVLLIACANVANLVLARAAGQARQIALRLSLGASRARIVQQLLAESILIAAAGGALGGLLAMWSSQGLVMFLLSALPGDVSTLAIDASPNLRVLAFSLALTAASALLFGLTPALQASRLDLQAVTKSGMADIRGRGPTSTLLVVQVATCMVLMISAGLLLRALHAAQSADPGFRYENIAVANLRLSEAGYDVAGAADFQRRFLERVAALPSVEAVAQSERTPMTPGTSEMIVHVRGEEQWRRVLVNVVSPTYFSLIGTPIVRGRTFTDSELANGSRAMIVTENTARQLWPGREPIGRTLTADLGRSGAIEFAVVGVVKDAQITSIGVVDPTLAYVPAVPIVQPKLKVLAKGGPSFEATAAGMRAAAAEIDPAVLVRVTPLEANLDYWRRLASILSTLSTSLGMLALVLTAVGVYGIVSYTAGRRVREIGIRVALGARPRDVVRIVTAHNQSCRSRSRHRARDCHRIFQSSLQRLVRRESSRPPWTLRRSTIRVDHCRGRRHSRGAARATLGSCFGTARGVSPRAAFRFRNEVTWSQLRRRSR